MMEPQEGSFNPRKAQLNLNFNAKPRKIFDKDVLQFPSFSSPAKSPLMSPLETPLLLEKSPNNLMEASPISQLLDKSPLLEKAPIQPVSSNMEITTAQKQYAQGFLDALRSVQSLHNFEFDNSTAFSPGYIMPNVKMLTDLPSPLVTTPISSRELQSILQAMVTTPLGSAPTAAAAAAGFPAAFSSILPGPSTTSASIPSSSVSTGSSDGGTDKLELNLTTGPIMNGLKIDIKQEMTLSDDSPDSNCSDDLSRSSSTAPNGGGSCSSLPSSSLRSSKAGMSLDEQERRKLERKRARNRAAASKCRQKKMDRINELETQVQTEKARSQMLDTDLLRMRQALHQLEQIVQRHRACAQC